MKYLQLLKEVIAILEDSGIDNCRNEARWLILESTSLSSGAAILDPEIAENKVKHILALAQRRGAHEPLQYILGTAPFGELELNVTPAVLIPRPETEILTEKAIDLLPENGRLLDLGCGSGAIALLAAFRRKDIRVTAVDKSRSALSIAVENSRKYDLADRVDFIESDLFSALEGEKFDVIAANLPYVTFEEYACLDYEVRMFEPESALTAAENGLALIRDTISGLKDHLNCTGAALFEMSPHQTGNAAGWLRENGFETDIFSDQYGKKRFVSGVLQ